MTLTQLASFDQTKRPSWNETETRENESGCGIRGSEEMNPFLNVTTELTTVLWDHCGLLQLRSCLFFYI